MVILELAGIAIVFLAVAGFLGVIRGRIERHGAMVLAWRWLTGAPWHGRAITDAGWLRPGTRALTRTGHAPRFHHRPRLHRAARRTGTTVAVLAAMYGAVADRHVTLLALAALAILAVPVGVWRIIRWARGRAHHRAWVAPLHVAVAPLVGRPVESRAQDWVHVARDRSHAVLDLPHGWRGSNGERDQIASLVPARLGMESPEVKWQLAGPRPKVAFDTAPPPPTRAGLDDIRGAIEKAKPGQLVLGIGRSAATVTVSLHGDSPHLGVSMGTGAGKSTLARLLTAQVLYRGGVAMVLDAKVVSHPWAFGLPNVAYADTPETIHDALCWLGGELDRRNRVARVSIDAEGVIHANVGAPLLVIAEELNLAMPQLRRYWASIRDKEEPQLSPAIQALGALSFAGRAARMHILAIGQMLSAKSTGGGESRENLGVRILSRYTANAWKMLAPEHPMPVAPRQPGRVQVVTTTVRECQIAYLTGAQTQELATAGTVTPLPAGTPGAGTVAAVHTPGLPPAPAPSRLLTLSGACSTGVLPMSLAAVRTARHRDPAFPQPAGTRGISHTYDSAALAAWSKER